MHLLQVASIAISIYIVPIRTTFIFQIDVLQLHIIHPLLLVPPKEQRLHPHFLHIGLCLPFPHSTSRGNNSRRIRLELAASVAWYREGPIKNTCLRRISQSPQNIDFNTVFCIKVIRKMTL